jgi:glutathione peroxidase-family protein
MFGAAADLPFGLICMYTTKTSSTYADIIAFPCNQFGSQESKCDVDVKEFAKKKGAQFTMMAKIDVVSCCALARTAC